MTGLSRVKFDVFFRTLITGNNPDFTRPKSIKFAKNNLFPERGIVFDYFFQKVGGIWAPWEDLIGKSVTIPADAKVILISMFILSRKHPVFFNFIVNY